MHPALCRSWRYTLARLGGLLLGAVAVGLWLDSFWPFLAAALALALALHLWRLHRLAQRLRDRRRVEPLPGEGVWPELFGLVYRRQREARARKRRLVTMLRAFREAAAALPDAIVVLEAPERRIVWFNEAATRLLGLHYPQDIDARLTNLLRSPRVVEWLEAWRSDEPLLDVPGPGNEALRLGLRLIPYTGRQYLLVVRDISMLMRLEQVRRDFVANVSHELRTPLTVVHGYLDMIEPEDFPEIAAGIGEMRRQSARMAQIVEDLLTLSRLEAQDRLDEDRVAMGPMLRGLREEALALSQGRHAVSLADEAGCDLLGSSKELHSAFSNLVSNAIRYTPPGGEVRIRFHLDADGSPCLAVTDTGPGIPAQHLPRITERFYRVSSSRSRESGGTGLGLSIVKHVLNLHQAALEIESTPGKGSTFRCRFEPRRALAPEIAPIAAGV
jgi:two-component system, OmpR family, phosphate regulon sensor histidine kinase PhoR